MVCQRRRKKEGERISAGFSPKKQLGIWEDNIDPCHTVQHSLSSDCDSSVGWKKVGRQYCRENRVMDLQPTTVGAVDYGCKSCGATSTEFCVVGFRIFPAMLKQERHKEREQTVVYCRNCFESIEALPYLVDGQRLTVAKSGYSIPGAAAATTVLPPASRCSACDSLLGRCSPSGGKGIYGLLFCELFTDDTRDRGRILAVFCETCVESRIIRLVAKLPKKTKPSGGRR